MSTLQDRLAGLPSSPEPSTELATISAIQQIVPAEFFRAGGSEDILTKLETEVRARAAKLDISTDFGRKEIASLAYKVARSKTALDKSGKDLTEDIRKQKEAIDAERRKVTERLDSLKDEVRKPLTDWEDADKARKAAHEEVLAWMTGFADEAERVPHAHSARMLRESIDLVEHRKRDWEEFEVRAEGTRALAVKRLRVCLANAEQREAEALEAERQRKEAEERAIREREQAAAEAATKAAERKAQEALEAAQRAAQAEQQRLEREVAEQAAKAKQAEAQRIADQEAAAERERQAERQRLEDLRQAELRREREAAESKRREEAAVQAEKDRQAAEQKRKDDAAEADRLAEEKRTANKKHRAKIEGEIIAALVISFIPEAAASTIVEAIKEGRIPHVSIAY
jgi:hypothetical protein